MSPSVYAIMINYKTPDMTIECVNSILESDYDNCHIIVVDNYSNDDSVQKLRRDLPNDVVLLEASSNEGFSAGNNIGMKYAFEHSAEFVLLINNDTVIDKKMISILVNNCDRNSVVTPKIYYYDEPNKIWYGGGQIDYRRCRVTHNFENDIDEIKSEETVATDFISGCCMLIPNEVHQKIGYMCEDYFMYVEDVDYCLSMLNNGIELKYVPSAKMWHKVGASTGGQSKFTLYYANRGGLMLLKKYHFPLSAKCYRVAAMLVLGIKGLITKSNEKIIFKAMKDYRRGVIGKVSESFK